MSSVLDLRPQKLDIFITAGDSLSLELEIVNKDDGEPADLTGKVITASFRMSEKRGELTFFTSSVDANKVFLDLSKEQTEGKPVNNVWDCQIEDEGEGGARLTILSGRFVIDKDVTRP